MIFIITCLLCIESDYHDRGINHSLSRTAVFIHWVITNLLYFTFTLHLNPSSFSGVDEQSKTFVVCAVILKIYAFPCLLEPNVSICMEVSICSICAINIYIYIYITFYMLYMFHQETKKYKLRKIHIWQIQNLPCPNQGT